MAEMVAEEAEQEMIARWLEESRGCAALLSLDTGRVAVGRRHLYLLMTRI